MALEGGEGSASHPSCSLPPGKDPVPIVQEAGWAPRPVWTGVENLAPLGFNPWVMQPIASCLYKVGVLKSWVPGCPNDKILYCSEYYFQHNYCILFLDTKICVSSHALRRKHRITITFTGHFWILGLQGNMLHVTLLPAIILAWVPEFWGICEPPLHSVEQKSIGLIFRTSRSGSDMRYSCHHNSSRFTFPIFVHSWRFSVFNSLQSITPCIY